VKISKRLREDSAVLCLVGAQVGGLWTAAQLVDGTSVDEPNAARNLARVAHEAAYMAANDFYEDALVEAAALLRDGWSPGDPIVPWVPK